MGGTRGGCAQFLRPVIPMLAAETQPTTDSPARGLSGPKDGTGTSRNKCEAPRHLVAAASPIDKTDPSISTPDVGSESASTRISVTNPEITATAGSRTACGSNPVAEDNATNVNLKGDADAIVSLDTSEKVIGSDEWNGNWKDTRASPCSRGVPPQRTRGRGRGRPRGVREHSLSREGGRGAGGGRKRDNSSNNVGRCTSTEHALLGRTSGERVIAEGSRPVRLGQPVYLIRRRRGRVVEAPSGRAHIILSGGFDSSTPPRCWSSGCRSGASRELSAQMGKSILPRNSSLSTSAIESVLSTSAESTNDASGIGGHTRVCEPRDGRRSHQPPVEALSRGEGCVLLRRPEKAPPQPLWLPVRAMPSLSSLPGFRDTYGETWRRREQGRTEAEAEADRPCDDLNDGPERRCGREKARKVLRKQSQRHGPYAEAADDLQEKFRGNLKTATAIAIRSYADAASWAARAAAAAAAAAKAAAVAAVAEDSRTSEAGS